MAKRLERDYIGSFEDAISLWAPDGNYIHNITGYTEWIVTSTRKIFVKNYRQKDPFNSTGKGYLGILARTKAHITKRLNDGLIEDVPNSGQPYMQNFKIDGDCMCVDVRSAYITAARKIGAISDGMYRMLKRCAKKTRLAAIGTLAAKRNVITYVNHERVSFEIVEDPELLEVYRRITNRLNLDVKAVAMTMRQDFYCYWYDNFYCRTGTEARASNYFHQLGYETKITEGIKDTMNQVMNTVAI